jgi:hypothetical protein
MSEHKNWVSSDRIHSVYKKAPRINDMGRGAVTTQPRISHGGMGNKLGIRLELSTWEIIAHLTTSEKIAK